MDKGSSVEVPTFEQQTECLLSQPTPTLTFHRKSAMGGDAVGDSSLADPAREHDRLRQVNEMEVNHAWVPLDEVVSEGRGEIQG
jgi:hypothetical protein